VKTLNYLIFFLIFGPSKLTRSTLIEWLFKVD